MSSMYKLPPQVPIDFDVKPLDIMYCLPSYHTAAGAGSSDVTCNGLSENSHDPVEVIEHKQHALIKSLMNLSSTLDELLTEMGKSTSAVPNAERGKVPTNATPSRSENRAVTTKEDGKKDKEAKKEARKAAKAEAKGKVGSVPPVGANFVAMDVSDRQWAINEEKRASETNQSLTACLPQKFADFERQKLGDITLSFTVEDQPWVEVLSRLSAKRNVAFKGTVSNDCKDPSTTVNTSLGDKFSVAYSGCSLTCRVTSWKLFGAALGIFSYAANHSIRAAHQHRWLLKLDLVLSGKLTKESVVREASQFLSQFDALGSHFSLGIADVIARSVLIESIESRLPNNVELWVKRMDSVMKSDINGELVFNSSFPDEMPFMHGTMPLRRTFYYLLQGKIKFRDDVQVFAIGFQRRPTEEQRGTRDFVFWHWAQLQFKNPKVQLVKHIDTVITPFARAYLKDGREVLFDLEGMNREEIETRIATTLGKTELVMKREELMEIAKLNPADFGSKCKRQCMCEVQGQHPCTALLQAPKYMTGKWRWNHNLI
ncbi:hypothetical protein GCK32_003403 [Trichostrongylus colubriformis]|uniref:Small ribosomal subunit protein mS25 n=1 Tax=Trichostrongylus colubriformis TaxID=6319 RepID=A0AAN8FRY9_TRICO